VSATDSSLGFMLGRVFVEQKFSAEAKAEAQRMIGDIR
jgi:predicted metalloendopeptidase